MEKRKNPEKELKSKQGLFFHIGLLIAMMLCVSAFEYETKEIVVHIPDLEGDKTDIYLPPVTTHETIPRPPKPKLPDFSKVIPAEPEPFETEPEVKPDEVLPNDIDSAPQFIEPAPEIEMSDEPFRWVEEMPMPQGGYDTFFKFINENLKYPAKARRLNVQGMVQAEFIINENGELAEITIIKGIGAGCDEEVLRILELAPKWNPGKQRGIPVKVRTILPIYFRMD